MNPIQKALRQVTFTIPREVLMAAFVRREFGTSPIPVSLEQRIRTEVIEAIVLPDCNLVGGTTVHVPLHSINPERILMDQLIYRIPKTLTQNRSIVQVYAMNLVSGSLTSGQSLPVSQYSQLMGKAAAVMDTAGSIPLVSTAHLKLIGENTVLCTYNTTLPQQISLECRLENDSDLSQLQPTSYHRFAELVVLAVKTYIYTQLSISMGDAQLQGGMELGRFREVVDSYADSAELYATYLDEVWRVVALLDDQTSKEEVVKQLIGGHL